MSKKKGPIVLFLPGNMFHSNVTNGKLCQMLRERAGMDVLRQSPVPLVFGWQGIDEHLAPEIFGTAVVTTDVDQNQHIHELCAGSFTHVLHPLLNPADSEWQTKGWKEDLCWSNADENPDPERKERYTHIPVSFLPEFAPPKDLATIPTEFFFLMAQQTRYYEIGEHGVPSLLAHTRPGISAVRFKETDQVGILIQNRVFDKIDGREIRDPIREAWHAYQKTPDSERLNKLVWATEDVALFLARRNAGVHIVWLDLEAPYVGAETDATTLWEKYLEEIDRQGLKDLFSPLEPHLDGFRNKAEEIASAHRLLGAKWTTHIAQLDYIRRAYYELQAEKNRSSNLNRRQWRMLLSIARCSDVLSAMDSKIETQAGKTGPTATFRQELIDLCATCLDILNDKAPLDALPRADPVLGCLLFNLLRGLPDEQQALDAPPA